MSAPIIIPDNEDIEAVVYFLISVAKGDVETAGLDARLRAIELLTKFGWGQ